VIKTKRIKKTSLQKGKNFEGHVTRQGESPRQSPLDSKETSGQSIVYKGGRRREVVRDKGGKGGEAFSSMEMICKKKIGVWRGEE